METSDFAVRLLLVGVVLATAVVVALSLRRRSRSSKRLVRNSGLPSGVYFFSSSACLECSPVRESLLGRLGPDGFEENSWESNRELFDAINVDVVPSTLVVDESGLGTLWRGAPESMFSVVDP